MTESRQDVGSQIESMNRFLAARGLKSTRQRDLIAKTVLEADGHIGVEDIYQRVRRRDPKVGFSTVYRTMKLLKECGLVLERHFGDGLARYEAQREGEHHDHLICVECGSIVEFEDDEIERRQDAIAAKHGYVVRSHKHEIYGLCPRCAAKSGAGARKRKTSA